jgi:hypothetical protein
MTVQTDLQTALDAYIQANYSGSLAEVSAAKKPLEDLLRILDTVTTSGGGGSITNYALETDGNLANIALATGVDHATIPARTVLVGGQHDGKIENIKVDQTGAIVVNATGQQSSAASFSVVLATDQPAVTVTANAGTNLNTSALAITANQIPAFTNSPTNLGAANQAVLKPSAGAVYKIYCYNKNAATRFFQIHNKATAPVNADVPVEVFPVAGNSALIIDIAFFGASGRACSTGVAWAFSTTEATLTLGTAADQTSSVGYL